MTQHERYRRRLRHRGHPVRHAVELGGVVVLGSVGLVVTAAVVWVLGVAGSAPNLSELAPRRAHAPTQIYAADGSLIGYVHAETISDHVASDRIPQTLKQATVAIEDRRFWHHGALDYAGIVRAAVKDVFGGGHGLQGASTLTMQLVDNLYMPAEYRRRHNLKYKIVQAKLAEQLQSRHSKAWILDSYLNEIPYGTVNGETARGVGAASEMFFDKPVWKLSLAQQATLAGLPQSPTDYNPLYMPDLALARRNEVLEAMLRSGYITPKQAIAAEQSSLGAKAGDLYTRRTQPYVFDYALSELIQRYGLKTVENGGLKVYTTIDPRLQRLARGAISAHEPGGRVLDAQPAAALVSIDPANGHIVALGSSASYKQTTYDYPVQAHRQPGSAFKVFALMTLIHDYDGNPDKTYYKSRYLPAGWLPANPHWSVHTAEETYQGTISITKATVISDNTVFAQLVADLGAPQMDATAHAMGITSPLQGLPAEVIGGLKVGVTPLEMADAYATLANGGYHVSPTIIDRVVFPDRSVDPGLGHPRRKRVFAYDEVYAAIKVLKGVITKGTGVAANFGCPAAGKTGTAESLANAWFVGFTPRLATAVWVGYPQGNVGMADGFGGVLAAPIWHDFMAGAVTGYCGDWPAPAVPFIGTPFLGSHSVAAPTHKHKKKPAKRGARHVKHPPQDGSGNSHPGPTTTGPAPPPPSGGATLSGR